MTESLADLIRVEDLPQIRLNPKETPPDVHVRPVVGGAPEAIMTLEEVRKEWPVLRTAFLMAEELHQETNPGAAAELGIGPTFDELLDVSLRYLDSRVVPLEVGGVRSDPRDVGIYYWRRQALDALDTAIRGAGSAGVEAVPILGSPEWLDSANLRRFQWTGIVADGKRCHTNKVPVPYRPRKALRGLPRRREGRRPLLQERAARLFGHLLREQPPAAVLPGLHHRRRATRTAAK